MLFSIRCLNSETPLLLLLPLFKLDELFELKRQI